jgi:hypothetical protein
MPNVSASSRPLSSSVPRAAQYAPRATSTDQKRDEYFRKK